MNTSNMKSQENNECELNNVAVLPDYRHKGIGKKLIDHAFSMAKELGCNVMNIGIVEENIRLREWYEKAGAVHVGTHKADLTSDRSVTIIWLPMGHFSLPRDIENNMEKVWR